MANANLQFLLDTDKELNLEAYKRALDYIASDGQLFLVGGGSNCEACHPELARKPKGFSDQGFRED